MPVCLFTARDRRDRTDQVPASGPIAVRRLTAVGRIMLDVK
jgi:hypothetical protein